MKRLRLERPLMVPATYQVVLLCLLVWFIFSSPSTFAQETKPATDDNFSAEIGSGIHFFNVSGYRGKVGEYDVLKFGADTTFSITGNKGKNYFDLNGDFFAQNDQQYLFNIDLQRKFQTTFAYKRFIHYLDHDSLSNQDFVTDYNAGQSNHIIIEELKSGNTLQIPEIPFLKFKMNYRSYAKRGHRQATTVTKCSECHVTSRNKRVNDRLEDVAFGVEGTAGPATLEYTRHWISFNENATAPINNYGDGASFFLVKGFNPYSQVPEIYNSIHEFKVRSLLPFSSTLFTSYQTGERTNRDTHHDIDYYNVATRLSNYVLKYCMVDAFYNQYHMDNSTPDAIDRDFKRGGVDVSTVLKKRVNLKFSYIWENIDRDNFPVNYTKVKTYRLTANYRALRKLRFHFKYEKTKVGNPFVTEDQFFPNLKETTTPQSADLFYNSVSWNLRPSLTFNSSFRYHTGKNDRYHMDEDLYEFTTSFWYIPFEQTTITGAYTISRSKVESQVTYKRYHLNDFKSLFLYNDIPYTSESQSYFLSASYLLHHKISLTGEITYTRSFSDFDSYLGSEDLGSLSNLKINRLDTALGISYLYSSQLTLSAKYLFREYNDKHDNSFDGQFNGISIGFNWSFK